MEPDGQAAVLSSPRRARTCRCPRSRRCPRRTCPSESRLRRSRTRSGGPRRARRDAAGRARAARPSGPPSSRARRFAPGGSRSAAAGRRGAGRRRSASSPRFFDAERLRRLLRVALALVLGELRGHALSFALRAAPSCASALLRLARPTRGAPPSGRRPRPPPPPAAPGAAALRLRADQVQQLLAVRVVVLLGLERPLRFSTSDFAMSTSAFRSLAA